MRFTFLSQIARPAIYAAATMVAVGSVSAAPTLRYDFGNPSDRAQHLLELINRARSDPAAAAERIRNSDDPRIQGALSYFGVDLEKLQAQFDSYEARAPLAWNAALIASADDQTDYMLETGVQTHARPAGTSGAFRASFVDAGYPAGSGIAENVFASCYDVWYAHAGLLVDWGWDAPDDGDGMQSSLGHRKNLLDFEGPPVYLEAGISVADVDDPGSKLGPLVVTEHFGYQLNKSYLTGVVYDDRDGDGFYTPGEGLAGVRIMPDKGNYYAVTSSSGGYVIPMGKRTGPLTVTASGGELGETIRYQLTLTPDNRKLDIVDGEFVDWVPNNTEDYAIADSSMQSLPWMAGEQTGWVYDGPAPVAWTDVAQAEQSWTASLASVIGALGAAPKMSYLPTGL